MTERELYEDKKKKMHIGPCSSARMKKCPCPHICPNHGRCCDCIAMHMAGAVNADKGNDWMPYCMAHPFAPAIYPAPRFPKEETE